MAEITNPTVREYQAKWAHGQLCQQEQMARVPIPREDGIRRVRVRVFTNLMIGPSMVGFRPDQLIADPDLIGRLEAAGVELAEVTGPRVVRDVVPPTETGSTPDAKIIPIRRRHRRVNPLPTE